MSRYYDKEELKSKLDVEQIFDLVSEWGGEPEYTSRGLVSQTICHNAPGVGSRKLYYYENTRLFKCFTACNDSFDIFELCIKVMDIQHGRKWELYDAMDYVASYFGIDGIEQKEDSEELEDWKIFKRHAKDKAQAAERVTLKEYDATILSRFAYPRIASWEREGIAADVALDNGIGYYPGKEQITIPHYDIDGRLIGIRGRSLAEDEAARYGKYRPIKIGQTIYSHPLSMNLYHLNRTKENIQKTRLAIVFESEKSCLMYESYYGKENDISVSCCGSSISSYQIYLLQSLGVNELIIAFDRDFTEIGDESFMRLKQKLIHIYNKYSQTMRISAIFDKTMILPIHASPIDVGKQTFEKLLHERIIPKE